MTVRSSNRLHQRRLAACIGACLMSSGATAEELLHHGVHQHGVSHMDIAVMDGELVVSLHGPMTNFTGFEHAPTTAAQQQAIDAAIRQLNDPGRLMTIDPQATCSLQDTTVTVPDFGASTDHAGHEHAPASGRHGHDSAHQHQHQHQHQHSHEEHHHDEGHHHGHGAVHYDLAAGYAFSCDRAPRWLMLEPVLFEGFPWTQALEANVVGPDVQKRDELNARSRRVALDR